MHCGILGFHGNIEEHAEALRLIGVTPVRIVKPEQLELITHLIIPGGESTVMSAFLIQTGMREKIQEKIKDNKLVIFGTCAGAILLAKKIISNKKIETLDLVDITIERNAYGSQVYSFETDIFIPLFNQNIKAVFVRAPIIRSIGNNIKILATHENNPVLLQENNILLSTFHPEYLSPPVIHKHFLDIHIPS